MDDEHLASEWALAALAVAHLFAAAHESADGTSRTSGDVRLESAKWAKADIGRCHQSRFMSTRPSLGQVFGCLPRPRPKECPGLGFADGRPEPLQLLAGQETAPDDAP
jgi:hypothetical protein